MQETNHIATVEREVAGALPRALTTSSEEVKCAVATGNLIVNADDWGRDPENTDRTLDCAMVGAVSSVSAMVFMDDSERAANLAQEHGIDAGLHLNLTTAFSSGSTPARVRERQERVARYLSWHRFGYVVFHPGLMNSFEYVVSAQLEEFGRLYGRLPKRIDGHHHAHLCANVLYGKLLPERTIVRRNFSFRRGEKGLANRLYRRWVDQRLARRHRLVDYFFALEPLESQERLRHIFSYARQFRVEVETHPLNQKEYAFLRSGAIFEVSGDIPIARRYEVTASCDVATEVRPRANSQVVRGGLAKPTPRTTVLVGFAEAISAPEVVWSLVDEGYEVVAFARKGRASALRHSRHVVCHNICAPETDVQAALSELKALMRSLAQGTASSNRVLLPLDDKSLLLCSRLTLDEGWLLAGAEGGRAELALNKHLQVRVAGAAGFNVPRTALVRTEDDVRRFIAAESYPLILKSANCVSIDAGRANTCPQWICANEGELERALREWGERLPLLAQPFIEGTGEGIFGLAAPDGIRAWSAHRRLRMMNPKGSGSSACISQSVSEDLRRKADDFVSRTGWRGMFMIELLRDRLGNVFFVEFNGRPWGSMALSRAQGLEYPAWQIMLALDPDFQAGIAATNTPGIVSRNVGRELMHLLFVLRGPRSKALRGWPSIWKSLRDVASFHFRDTLYNWRRDDPKVFMADMSYTIKNNLFKGAH
jgi:chitin disaccharide deacetylase